MKHCSEHMHIKLLRMNLSSIKAKSVHFLTRRIRSCLESFQQMNIVWKIENVDFLPQSDDQSGKLIRNRCLILSA